MAGVFISYDASNPAEWFMCLVIQASCLSGLGNCGGIYTIVIITLERYWKIVYPLHHRKYYRSWMVKLGLILPWFIGIVTRVVPYLATTRIAKGRCMVMAFVASPVIDEVNLGLSRFGTDFCSVFSKGYFRNAQLCLLFSRLTENRHVQLEIN